MSKGIIDKLLDNIVDSVLDDEWKGRYGEKLTARELKKVSLLGRKGKILRNIYLPKDNGETSEIDVIYICQKGIFIFESKNYSGWIFGDEKSPYWTASLPNGKKNKFYNPIMQNKTHLKWMSFCIGAEVPLFSIIVFSERCELKKIEITSTEIKVIKRDRTYATVRDIWDIAPDKLSDEQIDHIYKELKKYTNVDSSVKTRHIEDIEKRHSDLNLSKKDNELHGIEDDFDFIVPEEDMKYDDEIDEIYIRREGNSEISSTEKRCPRCGSSLVLRTAKKGENVGLQFWGCSSFPKCRYIESINNGKA